MNANEMYHDKQFETPYRSTIAFDKFLKKNTNLEGVNILDLACGGGANTYYFAKKYENSFFTGLDIDTSLFLIFDSNGGGRDNIKLIEGDWLNLPGKFYEKFDGVISLQALSWLPNWEQPIEQICKIHPKWIAISSLFYEGEMDYIIRCYNYERPDTLQNRDHTEAFYNIYSIPRIKKYLYDKGYKIFNYMPFEIDIDIPKPSNRDWGTYTVKTENGKRLQISAAMLLPWYFIYAER